MYFNRGFLQSVNLKNEFDSVHCKALCSLLWFCWILVRTVSPLTSLNSGTEVTKGGRGHVQFLSGLTQEEQGRDVPLPHHLTFAWTSY